MKIKPNKKLGQNFLKDENILSNIVDCGNLVKGDTVLEIGPGTGNLTKKLIEKEPDKVLVVEKDKELSELLKKKFGKKVEVINKDILDCYNDFKFERPIKVFGNLPYNISTKILVSFIKMKDLNKFFDKFIFVFQKEVADRILASENTKNYGRLSIVSSWKLNISKINDIDPKYFYPVPKVWSTLITLKPRSKFEKIKEIKNLEHVTNIFFNQRRKKIKKPMKQLFENFNSMSEKLRLNLDLRPQNISIQDYLKICKVYENLKH